jgi:DNA topoisomerase-1
MPISRIAYKEMRRRLVRSNRVRLKSMIEPVAEALGNTAAISRKSYVHPALIEAAGDAGALDTGPLPRRTKYLSGAERGLIGFLDAMAGQPKKAA